MQLAVTTAIPTHSLDTCIEHGFFLFMNHINIFCFETFKFLMVVIPNKIWSFENDSSQ